MNQSERSVLSAGLYGLLIGNAVALIVAIYGWIHDIVDDEKTAFQLDANLAK